MSSPSMVLSPIRRKYRQWRIGQYRRLSVQCPAFSGLQAYYRKFIQHYGSIVAPLNRLLRKDGFEWTPVVDADFQHLKDVLTHAPFFQHLKRLLDFTKPFVVKCNACGHGIGAVLMQQRQPIAYFSEALQGNSLNLSTCKKEMLAVAKSVRKWRPYLLYNSFIVRTDHRSLRYLLEQRITTPA